MRRRNFQFVFRLNGYRIEIEERGEGLCDEEPENECYKPSGGSYWTCMGGRIRRRCS